MTKTITTIISISIVATFLWAMVAGPGAWDASAAYTDTTEAPHGLTDVVPHFAGLEAGVSSESIHFVNEYGTCGWEVNECWLTDFIGAAPAAPHNILSATHNDAVVAAAVAGDIIYADATPDWNRLPIGAPGDIVTVVAGFPAYAAPVVQTSTLLDNAVHTDTITSGETAGDLVYGTGAGWDDLAIGVAGDVLTVVGGAPVWQAPVEEWVQIAEANVVVAGADSTTRGGGAVAGAAEDVAVIVTCREVNGGVTWHATSHPMPVADMVTYYWEVTAGNLVVHIMNDSQLDVLATVQYNEL